LRRSSYHLLIIKSVSLALVFCFLFQELSYAGLEILKADRACLPAGRDSGEREKKENLHWAKELLPDIPGSVATIEDAWQAPVNGVEKLKSLKVIYLIQDAHANPSAQFNIAKTLDLIFSRSLLSALRSPSYVFLEGGYLDNSLSFLKKYSTPQRRKQAAESFVHQGKLQGVEYQNIVGDKDFTIWGVEELSLYAKSISAYRVVAKDREKFEDYLKKVESSINTLKSRIYNPLLLSWDKKYWEYQKPGASLTDYFEALKHQAQVFELNLSKYPHLKALEDLKDFEQKIDFKKANGELQKAVASLPEKESHSLFKVSVQNHTAESGFFALLEENLSLRGREAVEAPPKIAADPPRTMAEISSTRRSPRALRALAMTDYIELFKYFNYLKKSKSLNFKSILEDQKKLENDLFEKMTTSEDEKNLIQASQNLGTLKKLLNLTLTPDEYEAYKNEKENFSVTRVTGFLNRKIMELKTYYQNAVFLEEGYEDIVKHAEEFYELTYERDKKFVENMLRVIASGGAAKQSPAILITGGYHSPNLKYLLKQQNISYVSITPQVTRETNQALYEKLLLNQTIDTKFSKLPLQITQSPLTHTNNLLASLVRSALNDHQSAFEFSEALNDPVVVHDFMNHEPKFGGPSVGLGGVGSQGGRPRAEETTQYATAAARMAIRDELIELLRKNDLASFSVNFDKQFSNREEAVDLLKAVLFMAQNGHVPPRHVEAMSDLIKSKKNWVVNQFPGDDELRRLYRSVEDALYSLKSEVTGRDPALELLGRMMERTESLMNIGGDLVDLVGDINEDNELRVLTEDVLMGDESDDIRDYGGGIIKNLRHDSKFRKHITEAYLRKLYHHIRHSSNPIYAASSAWILAKLLSISSVLGCSLTDDELQFFEDRLFDESPDQYRVAVAFFARYPLLSVSHPSRAKILDRLRQIVEDSKQDPQVRKDAFDALRQNFTYFEPSFFEAFYGQYHSELGLEPLSQEPEIEAAVALTLWLPAEHKDHLRWSRDFSQLVNYMNIEIVQALEYGDKAHPEDVSLATISNLVNLLRATFQDKSPSDAQVRVVGSKPRRILSADGFSEAHKVVVEISQGIKGIRMELAQLKPGDPKSINRIQDALGSAEYKIRIYAILALVRLRVKEAIAVPILIGLLKRDPHPRVRSDSAWALAEIGSGDESVVAALEEAVKDGDSSVSQSVKMALFKIRHEPPNEGDFSEGARLAAVDITESFVEQLAKWSGLQRTIGQGLIVEDRSIIAKSVKRNLERLIPGSRFEVVGSIEEALPLIRGGREFDLVWTDRHTGEGPNGIDLIRAIREQETEKGKATLDTQSIIVLASSDLSEIPAEFLGGNHFYLKKIWNEGVYELLANRIHTPSAARLATALTEAPSVPDPGLSAIPRGESVFVPDFQSHGLPSDLNDWLRSEFGGLPIIETVFEEDHKYFWATSLKQEGRRLMIRMNGSAWHDPDGRRAPMYDVFVNNDSHGYQTYFTLQLDSEGRVDADKTIQDLFIKERRARENPWMLPLLRRWILSLHGSKPDINHPLFASYPRYEIERDIYPLGTAIYNPGTYTPEHPGIRQLPPPVIHAGELPELARIGKKKRLVIYGGLGAVVPRFYLEHLLELSRRYNVEFEVVDLAPEEKALARLREIGLPVVRYTEALKFKINPDNPPDGILVLTRPDSHFPIAELANRYHVPAFVEKPIVLPDHLSKLREHYRQHPEELLAIDFFFDNPSVAEALKLITEGKIGKIRSMRGEMIEDRAVEKGREWLLDRGISGGGLGMDMLVHLSALGEMILERFGLSFRDAGLDPHKLIFARYEGAPEGSETYARLKGSIVGQVDFDLGAGKGLYRSAYYLVVTGDKGSIEINLGTENQKGFMEFRPNEGEVIRIENQTSDIGFAGTTQKVFHSMRQSGDIPQAERDFRLEATSLSVWLLDNAQWMFGNNYYSVSLGQDPARIVLQEKGAMSLDERYREALEAVDRFIDHVQAYFDGHQVLINAGPERSGFVRLTADRYLGIMGISITGEAEPLVFLDLNSRQKLVSAYTYRSDSWSGDTKALEEALKSTVESASDNWRWGGLDPDKAAAARLAEKISDTAEEKTMILEDFRRRASSLRGGREAVETISSQATSSAARLAHLTIASFDELKPFLNKRLDAVREKNKGEVTVHIRVKGSDDWVNTDSWRHSEEAMKRQIDLRWRDHEQVDGPVDAGAAVLDQLDKVYEQHRRAIEISKFSVSQVDKPDEHYIVIWVHAIKKIWSDEYSDEVLATADLWRLEKMPKPSELASRYPDELFVIQDSGWTDPTHFRVVYGRPNLRERFQPIWMYYNPAGIKPGEGTEPQIIIPWLYQRFLAWDIDHKHLSGANLVVRGDIFVKGPQMLGAFDFIDSADQETFLQEAREIVQKGRAFLDEVQETGIVPNGLELNLHVYEPMETLARKYLTSPHLFIQAIGWGRLKHATQDNADDNAVNTARIDLDTLKAIIREMELDQKQDGGARLAANPGEQIQKHLLDKTLEKDGVEFRHVSDLNFDLLCKDVDGRKTMFSISHVSRIDFPDSSDPRVGLIHTQVARDNPVHFMDSQLKEVAGWIIAYRESHDRASPAIWTYKFGEDFERTEIISPDKDNNYYEESLQRSSQLSDIRVDSLGRLRLYTHGAFWHRAFLSDGLGLISSNDEKILGEGDLSEISKIIVEALTPTSDYSSLLFIGQGDRRLKVRKNVPVTEQDIRNIIGKGDHFEVFSAIGVNGRKYLGIRPKIKLSAARLAGEDGPLVKEALAVVERFFDKHGKSSDKRKFQSLVDKANTVEKRKKLAQDLYVFIRV